MKNNLIKIMAISSIMSILLLYFRIQWSGNLHFAFLVWNLFLAWIPFLCALALTELQKGANSKYVLLLLFCLWLVFFPNSPYILTDLFHLTPKVDVPLWFDLVLILSFAWNGLILGYTSLFEVHAFLNKFFKKGTVWCFITGIMILSGFGIYLGRYPRWNTWDIVNDPIDLFSNIFNLLIHPLNNTRMVGVTFFFSLFLMVSYLTLSIFIQHKQNDSE
ncbi:MAG: hypothetical protein A3F72_20005 [Bacteroidetes bacterium RIFCSPLOWO2_12_FULL_35_15]|nr:MAG: hypothetical protein A3F72_20005 [Bacteroidetes bacterium RIFCSPLOWO2_12_FULL_35_15]